MNLDWFFPTRHRLATGNKKKFHPLLEKLEDRLAPAVNSSLNGNQLIVTLSEDNDAAYLRVNGDYVEVDDNAAFSTPDKHKDSIVENITVTDTGAGAHTGQDVDFVSGIFDDAVLVERIETVDFHADFNMAAGRDMTVSGSVTVNGHGDISTLGGGKVSWTASRNIKLFSGADISVVDGNIKLHANQGGAGTSGTFVGIDMDQSRLVSSGAGKIELKGRGGDTLSDNYGVRLENASRLESQGANGGTITVAGTGGDGTSDNYGVYFTGGNTMVTSLDGNINISGNGGDVSVSKNHGVFLQAGAQVQSTGTGADAATITIAGTGGDGNSSNYGVYQSGANTKITSKDGNIDITGVGGNNSNNNYGVYLESGGVVESTGAGAAAATIDITGTGGNGTAQNFGVYLHAFEGATKVTSKDGDINITGNGDGSHFKNVGVHLYYGVIVESTGTGAHAATIDIIGTGSNGTTDNYGVWAFANSPKVRSIEGNIYISGTGGNGSSSANHGVYLISESVVESTGSGAASATITIDGTGGAGTSRNYGVRIRDEAKVTAIDGDIVVAGASNGSTYKNHGVCLEVEALIESTGAGADAATIDITGTGGAGTSNNHGVCIVDDAKVLSNDGDITVTATGLGTDLDNDGLFLTGGIEASNDANISVTGDATTGIGINVVQGSLGTSNVQAGGDLTLSTDTFSLRDPKLFMSFRGDLTIKPLTPGTTMGIGPYAQGTLRLTDAELAHMAFFNAINLGDSNTGPVDVNAARFFAPVAISGESISVSELRGANFVTLNATSGVIHEGGAGTAIVTGLTTFNGDIAPGHSPGQLVIDSWITLNTNNKIQIELLDSSTPGITYDQLRVEGINRTVKLENATLDVSLLPAYSGKVGDRFIIIDNVDADSEIEGTFADLAEGAKISVDNHLFVISYQGGDGNDVVLTQAFGIGDHSMSYKQDKLDIDLVPLGGTYSVEIAGSKAYFLDQELNLELHSGGEFENLKGMGEKWVTGDVNQLGSIWYYIKPDGQFFASDGNGQSTLLETLPGIYHHNLDLLYNAGAEHLASVLDQALNLHLDPAGTYENLYSQGEKWLRGDVNRFGQTWYLFRPNGELFAWNGSFGPNLGQLIATLETEYHAELNRLYDAQPNQIGASISGNKLTLDPVAGFTGDVHAKLTHSNGNTISDIFKFSAINTAPDLTDIADQSIPTTQDDLTVPLAASDADNDTIIFTAQGGNLGYVLKQRYGLGLHPTGDLFFDFFGAQEKWLIGRNGQWFFIKPDGELIRWDGATAATGEVLAIMDFVFYDKPELIYSATAQDLAYAIDQAYGLFVDGSLFQDLYGQNEKWLKDANGDWNFILENGELYRWDGTPGQAVGQLLAKFDPIYWQEPHRLHNAAADRFTLAINGSNLTVDPADEYVGWFYLLVTASDGLKVDFSIFKMSVTG